MADCVLFTRRLCTFGGEFSKRKVAQGVALSVSPLVSSIAVETSSNVTPVSAP